jgi:hypothetical protein
MTGRLYAKLHIRLHADENWRGLSADAQWLYSHLISHPAIINAGVLPLQIARWARGATDMTVERVSAGLHELIDRDFVIVDPDTEEVLVRTFIRDDAPNPKVLHSVLEHACMVESQWLRGVLAKEIRALDRKLDSKQLEYFAALEASVSQLPAGHPETQRNMDATPVVPKGFPKGFGKGFPTGNPANSGDSTETLRRTCPRCGGPGPLHMRTGMCRSCTEEARA